MSAETVKFKDWLESQMADPEFREAWEASEPAYQVARLRIMRGLSQEQLAELVGTKQPSIARLESGKADPQLPFLRRVAEALGARLEVRFVPVDDTQTTTSVAQPKVATTRAAKAT
jgi:transcriptional regulator with XRE-family HTH domain